MKKKGALGEPKHVRIREFLRERIATGAYPPGSRLPTEDELPRLMRVSSTTIVRALNDLVHEGLIYRRRRIGSYVIDPNARPLIPGRALRIGVLANHTVLPDLQYTGEFQRRVLSGILKAWRADGQGRHVPAASTQPSCMVWSAPACGVTVELLGEALATRHMHPPLERVVSGGYDGLIAMAILEDTFLRQIANLNKPLVLVDYPGDGFTECADQVYFDPLAAFRKTLARFVERGARRVHYAGAWVRKPKDNFDTFRTAADRFEPAHARPDPDSLLRLNAFRQALAELELPFSDASVHFTWQDEKRIAPVASGLAARPEHERPDAILCHSTLQAQVFADRFAHAGLPLLSAGVTDTGYLGPVMPVFASGHDMGRTAASLLLWRLQQPDRLPLRTGVPMTA